MTEQHATMTKRRRRAQNATMPPMTEHHATMTGHTAGADVHLLAYLLTGRPLTVAITGQRARDANTVTIPPAMWRGSAPNAAALTMLLHKLAGDVIRDGLPIATTPHELAAAWISAAGQGRGGASGIIGRLTAYASKHKRGDDWTPTHAAALAAAVLAKHRARTGTRWPLYSPAILPEVTP